MSMDQKSTQRLTEAELDDLLEKPALSVPEVAVIFDIDVKTAYAAVKRGEIASINFGRLKRIPTAWVRRRLAGDA